MARKTADGPGRDAARAEDPLDDLDRMLLVWAREIPDLDPLTEGIVERLGILKGEFESLLDETLASSELDRALRLSSGAMTNRLDRMEQAGLIRRLPDPSDRRGVLVEPTKQGHARWDRAVGVQAQREALFASVLDPSERAELHRLLRRLMRAFPDNCHVAKWAEIQTPGGDGPG
jgi:DNA-binding MarR family transcriptional regulator